MKYNPIKILAAILFSFSLSGCLNYEQVTNLKIDGSGDTYIHFWTGIKKSDDSLVVVASGLFDESSLKEKFNVSFIEITEIETYRNMIDSTIHSKVKFSFSDIDSLNLLNLFSGVSFVFEEDENEDIIFKHIINPSSTDYGFPEVDCVFFYTYYIPGKIIEHNANRKSNNKLEWKFSSSELNKSNTLMARFTPYKLKETPLWIYYLSLFIFIVVVLYLFKKKRT